MESLFFLEQISDKNSFDQPRKSLYNKIITSNAFKNTKTMSPEEVAETRKNLLAYCKLDTFAMVKVWEKLKVIVE